MLTMKVIVDQETYERLVAEAVGSPRSIPQQAGVALRRAFGLPPHERRALEQDHAALAALARPGHPAADARDAETEDLLAAAMACADLLIKVVRPMYSGPTGDQGINDPFYGELLSAIGRYNRARAALASEPAAATEPRSPGDDDVAAH
jgi:hypothetical protein